MRRLVRAALGVMVFVAAVGGVATAREPTPPTFDVTKPVVARDANGVVLGRVVAIADGPGTVTVVTSRGYVVTLDSDGVEKPELPMYEGPGCTGTAHVGGSVAPIYSRRTVRDPASSDYLAEELTIVTSFQRSSYWGVADGEAPNNPHRCQNGAPPPHAATLAHKALRTYRRTAADVGLPATIALPLSLE